LAGPLPKEMGDGGGGSGEGTRIRSHPTPDPSRTLGREDKEGRGYKQGIMLTLVLRNKQDQLLSYDPSPPLPLPSSRRREPCRADRVRPRFCLTLTSFIIMIIVASHSMCHVADPGRWTLPGTVSPCVPLTACLPVSGSPAEKGGSGINAGGG
jgi:hypothetical protein